MKKMLVIPLIALILLAGMMAGCTEDEDEGDIKITDQTGETISFSETPDRIISLTPSITEILFTLGLEDNIVGIDDASTFPSATADIEKVSSWQGIDLEAILALEPDVVLMDKTLDMSGERYNDLVGVDLKVVRMFPQNLDEILKQITIIGSLFEVDDKAKEVVNGLETRIEVIETSVSGDSKPKVLYVTYYDGSADPWVGSSSSFSGSLIAKAGGENIIDDGAGIAIQVSLEVIIEQDPDIIFTSQSTIWATVSRETILSDDVLKGLSAVKKDQVYDIDGDLIDRTGPRIVDGLEMMNTYIASAEV